jgi:flagellar motility protein MotE (MotC chaperone)
LVLEQSRFFDLNWQRSGWAELKLVPLEKQKRPLALVLARKNLPLRQKHKRQRLPRPRPPQEEKMGKGWSDEEMSFFKKLNDRKKEQDLREAELNKMEEELQRQKVELDEKIKRLEAMRGEISQTLKARVASDQEKVDKLVQMYSSMKPQQASKIIESLNEDLAVEVLDKMKKKSAAEIMNAMDSKKAQRLSELLTGYQRMPSSAKTSGEQID